MEELWIVHDEPGARAALVQLARGVARRVQAGAASDATFEAAPPAAVVVLGLSADLEPALAFARQHGRRRLDARWLLLLPPDLPEARVERLFGGLGARPWRGSPTSAAFRAALAEALAGPEPLSLAEARRRELLERRFQRQFADLALGPERLDALGADRVLVRGEAGTGRTLLARALHARSAAAGDAFAAVSCGAEDTLDALLARASASRGEATALTVCLEQVDALDPGVQRELVGRLERAELLPEDLGVRRLRWLASCGDGSGPEPELAGLLGVRVLRLPPLRERPAAVEPFVASVVAEWCADRQRPGVVFASDALDLLRAAPWPGNFRELEATLVRTLASARDGTLGAADLRLVEEQGDELLARREPRAKTEAWAGSEPGGTGDAWSHAESERPADPDAAVRAPAVEGDARARRDGSLATAPGGAADVTAPGDAAPRRIAPADAARRPAPAAPRGEATPGDGPGLERLVGALAHAMRNPLVAIHAFAALLPERFEDPEFRERFHEQVIEEVDQIERLVQVLTRFAEFGPPRRAPVDVTGLLEAILEEHRGEIQRRGLLVLKELDTTRPLVTGDEAMLRFAIEGLLERALRWVPERADLFVASKYHPTGPSGAATVRVLMRFFNPVARRAAPDAVEPAARADVSAAGTALEFLLAEQLIRAQGGSLRVDSTEADETVVLLDLPAPD